MVRKLVTIFASLLIVGALPGTLIAQGRGSGGHFGGGHFGGAWRSMPGRVVAPGVQRPAFVGRPSPVVVPSFGIGGIGGVTVVPQFRGGVRPQRVQG